jgi:dCMP deaminase
VWVARGLGRRPFVLSPVHSLPNTKQKNEKQVGACIVSPDRIILGIGYNGFPRGCPDDALPWAKRAPAAVEAEAEGEADAGGGGGGCAHAGHHHHRRGPRARRFPPGILGTKYPYVCHAEMNAILNKNATSLAGAVRPSIFFSWERERRGWGFSSAPTLRPPPRASLRRSHAHPPPPLPPPEQSMYVTMFPCNECSKLLIQAGIREVVFYEDKQANAEAPGAAGGAGRSGGGGGSGTAAGVGGMAPAEAYAASRALLDLAGVAVRQHAPAEPLVLHVAPLPPGGVV